MNRALEPIRPRVTDSNNTALALSGKIPGQIGSPIPVTDQPDPNHRVDALLKRSNKRRGIFGDKTVVRNIF